MCSMSLFKSTLPTHFRFKILWAQISVKQSISLPSFKTQSPLFQIKMTVNPNLKNLSWKLSVSHKEFSVSKPKNVSKSINRQKENTKNNKNNFSIYLIQQFHLWVPKQCLVPYSSNFWKKENNCTGYFICQAGSRKITP